MTSVPLQLMRKREWTEGNVADGHRPSDINRRGTRDPERQPNGNACPDQLHVDPPTSRDLIVAHPKRDAASAVSLPGGASAFPRRHRAVHRHPSRTFAHAIQQSDELGARSDDPS